MTTLAPPQLVADVPETTYHAHPALSQSGAKLLLESPAKYRHRMDEGPQTKDTFDFGHAAHAKVLGVGLELVTIHADDWRTKAAQEAKKAAHVEGKTPLLAKDVARVDAMAKALEQHPTASAILRRDGEAELSMWWTEHATDGTEVPARGRIDFATTTATGAPALVDYKSTNDASPAGFAKSVITYGYDMQDVAYRSGWRHITGDDPAFIFIAQEKDAPYLVGVYSLDWSFNARGAERWQRALDLFAECTATGHWPGYSPEITELTPPRWA